MNSFNEKIKAYWKMRKTTLSFFGYNQYHDWQVLVFLTMFGFLLVTGLGAYVHSIVGSSAFFDTDVPVVSAKKVNTKVLSDMLLRLETKQKAFDDVKKTKPVVTDPSL